MSDPSIGVAVIGAGMAGRAHANGYRTAATVYGLDRPAPRLVAVADTHEPFATDAARRYGFARAETDWRGRAPPPRGRAPRAGGRPPPPPRPPAARARPRPR